MSNNDELHLKDLNLTISQPITTDDEKTASFAANLFIGNEVGFRTQSFFDQVEPETSTTAAHASGQPDEINIQVSARYGNTVTTSTMNLFTNEKGERATTTQIGVIDAQEVGIAQKLYDRLAHGFAADLYGVADIANKFGK